MLGLVGLHVRVPIVSRASICVLSDQTLALGARWLAYTNILHHTFCRLASAVGEETENRHAR